MNEHLKFIDSLVCLNCGCPNPTHHHLMRVEKKYFEPKPGTEQFLIPKYDGRGMAVKNPDRFAVPLCVKCHAMLHMSGDERAFFRYLGINSAEELALALWKYTGNRKKAMDLIKWVRLGNVQSSRI